MMIGMMGDEEGDVGRGRRGKVCDNSFATLAFGEEAG
jgi:hypothetical protein